MSRYVLLAGVCWMVAACSPGISHGTTDAGVDASMHAETREDAEEAPVSEEQVVGHAAVMHRSEGKPSCRQYVMRNLNLYHRSHKRGKRSLIPCH